MRAVSRRARRAPPRSVRRSPPPRVDAVANHPAAGDHHVAPGRARAAEDERVERVAPARRRAARRRARSTTSASARAPATRPQRALAGGRGAARERRARTAARRVDATPSSGAAATLRCAPRQALAVFEQAQLLAPVARRLAVGADRDRHAGGEPAGQVGAGRRRGWPRCSGTARCRRRLPRRRRSPAPSRGSRGPAASGRRARPSRTSHSIGRAPVAARQSSTSPVCSATWMWIGPAKPSASVASVAIDAALAARSEWIATPASSSGRLAPRICSRRLEGLVGRRAKAPLIVAQVGGGEAGALVQHRQQRQADAGIGGGVGQRPRHRQRIGVRAAVAGRCCR